MDDACAAAGFWTPLPELCTTPPDGLWTGQQIGLAPDELIASGEHIVRVVRRET